MGGPGKFLKKMVKGWVEHLSLIRGEAEADSQFYLGGKSVLRSFLRGAD